LNVRKSELFILSTPTTILHMKKSYLAIIGVALSLGLTSCGTQPGPNTQRGAATGGLLGAAAGGIIGHQSGRGLEGALIGGAAGATAGGLYGNARDQEQYNRY
jgi:hypothetical protein